MRGHESRLFGLCRRRLHARVQVDGQRRLRGRLRRPKRRRREQRERVRRTEPPTLSIDLQRPLRERDHLLAVQRGRLHRPLPRHHRRASARVRGMRGHESRLFGFPRLRLYARVQFDGERRLHTCLRRPRRRRGQLTSPRAIQPPVLATMMEAAHFRQRHDLAHAGRVDRSRLRRVLAQRQMSARPMVVGEVGLQDPVQVLLTEDNDVIEAFSTDRAHEAFGIWVLTSTSEIPRPRMTFHPFLAALQRIHFQHRTMSSSWLPPRSFRRPTRLPGRSSRDSWRLPQFHRDGSNQRQSLPGSWRSHLLGICRLGR